jgi:hypothetical protein
MWECGGPVWSENTKVECETRGLDLWGRSNEDQTRDFCGLDTFLTESRSYMEQRSRRIRVLEPMPYFLHIQSFSSDPLFGS